MAHEALVDPAGLGDSPVAALDLDEVRGSFPALKLDQVFLDNAGGSQTLGSVIDL